MCGVAGIFNLDGQPVNRRTIERMADVLLHRGPDARSAWVEGPVGLGHTRLSIRDLGEGGAQPMIWGADEGVVVSYNGEIYNDLSLRQELKVRFACEFHTTCDTEVIAPAYHHLGVEAFSRIEGMFALALWDKQRQELVLARDAVGVKPLYYMLSRGSIAFASEIKALLAIAERRPQLEPESLHIFLGQGYPGPERSLVAGIRPLPPGSFLIAGKDGIRIERYWRPERKGDIHDLEEALTLFEPLWRKVVQDHLVSDVPVGLLLSGGIDSPLIAAALESTDCSVSSLTVGFSISDFDEVEEASAVAKRFRVPHSRVSLNSARTEEQFLSVVEHFDGQCADSSALAFYAACGAAATQRQKVILTGDGADEFFAGYETYRASRIAAYSHRILPRGAAKFCSGILSRQNVQGHRRIYRSEKLARLLRGILVAPDCPHAQWRRYSYPEDLRALYSRTMIEAVDHHDALKEYTDEVREGQGTLVDRCLLADQNYYLPGDLLMKTDAMSMAHGVEVRVPFLDRRVMEFAGRLHQSLLTPFFGPDKYVLRQMAARLHVPATLVRRAKRGFNVPVAKLLRADLKPLGERLLYRQPDLLAPYIDPDGLRALWTEHQELRANYGYLLWALLTAAAWIGGLRSGGRRTLVAE